MNKSLSQSTFQVSIPAKFRKLINHDLLVFIHYTVFFLLLFAQFPLKGNMAGNCESWFVIAGGNTYIEKVASWLTGNTFGLAMYPATNVLAYGEASPGSAFLFSIFKLSGFNDLNSFYLFTASISILSAFGIYKLAEIYTGDKTSAIFAGLAFSCSNFILANIDDASMFLYFFPAMSTFYLLRFIQTARKRDLSISLLLGGIQIYFSVYVFVCQTILLTTVILCNTGKLVADHGIWHPGSDHLPSGKQLQGIRTLFKPLFLYYLLVPLPYLLFLLHSHFFLDIVSPWQQYDFITKGNFDLKPSDLLRFMPNNLIYTNPDYTINYSNFWPELRTHAFPGVLFSVLALLGMLRFTRQKVELYLVAIICFFISLGAYLHVNEALIPLPMHYVYEIIPLSTFFRIPFRAFAVTYLVLSIFAAFGLAAIIAKLKWENSKKAYLLVLAVSLIHFFEHTPFPLPNWDMASYYKAPEGYLNYFSDKTDQVILDLPSGLGISFEDAEKSLFEYNREMIYINWQTQHKQNIIGGVNGYYPKTRIDIQKDIYNIVKASALKELAGLGTDYIVFHKHLVLKTEGQILSGLRHSPYLVIVLEDEKTVIFKIAPELLTNS